MHNETHEIEITAKTATGQLAQVMFSRPAKGNIIIVDTKLRCFCTLSFEPAQLLLAARTLCDLPASQSSDLKSVLPHTAKLHHVLQLIAAERARQAAETEAGRASDSAPFNGLNRKLRVATVALGRVADGIATIESVAYNPNLTPELREQELRATHDDLRVELIQIAAVCVAFAESLTPEPDADTTHEEPTANNH